jgi:transcription termination factor Rho
MAKFIKFTKEILEAQHLSKLREIGRQIGLRQPAAKKKDELVKGIMGIQSGEIKPVCISNKGAPLKIVIDVSEFYADYSDYIEPEQKPMVRDSGKSDEKEVFEIEGVLEQNPAGYGFLRVNNYENSKDDAYVSMANIKKYKLRRGDKIKAKVKFVRENDLAALQEVVLINDLDPDLFLNRSNFDDLLPCYPTERLKLESGDGCELAIRCIDLFAPLGMGQRGLIVAPPKTGKTTLLKMIAQSIEKNYKDVKLIVLLIDERPEEVTDIKRSVNGEVVFSTFDENPEHHVRAAELVINRAKRLVEVGSNVVVLLDSITRLARAYNVTVESSGRTLSGGLDPVSLQGPKRFFGAARNIENGGSLTILSTALIDTGSRMDDVIYEEFKGTGNMEIHLSRELSERRIFPAIDLYKSGTRKEELLLTEKEMDTAIKLRKVLFERPDATDSLLEMLKKTKNNADLTKKLDAWLKLYQK